MIRRLGVLEESKPKGGGFVDTNLYLHVRGDNGNYTTNTSPWLDLSGNANNIPLFNSIPLIGDLLNYNGSNDYGQKTMSGITMSGGFTLETVAKFDSYAGSWRSLMNVRKSTSGGTGREFIEFRHNPSGQIGIEWLDFNGNGLSGGYSTVGLGNLFHAVITFDGITMKFYLNGTEELSSLLPFFTIGNNSILNVCQAYDNTRRSDNSLGMIRVYSVSLSQSEVVKNYNYEQTKFTF